MTFYQRLKDFTKKCLAHCKNEIERRYPDKDVRTKIYIAAAGSELFLFYLIGLLHFGIWNDIFLPISLLFGYIRTGVRYPFALFLLLSVVLWGYTLIKKGKEGREAGNTGRGFDISESNVYGSAREIKESELKQIADIVPKEAAMGTILGQLDTTEKKLITTKPIANFNNNTLILSPPGGGKTFTQVLNNIVQAIRRGDSVICTDTKGEVFAKTVELARRHGYLVRKFDLKDPLHSDGWHILSELQHDDIRAKIAAKTLMRNSGDEKDIHASAEEALLTALCLYVHLNPEIDAKDRNLYYAYSLLFNKIETLDTIFDSIRNDPEMTVAFDSYATFLQGSPNLRGNIVTNLANRLSILSSPAIKALTSTPDIDLTLPGKRKCIYFVELPDQHNSMKLLSSLFFSFLFWDLCDYADRQPSQKLPVNTCVLIEEAFACGEIPTLTNALATVRSRGISITLVAQGINQFEILYGKEMTESILECCATYACLGTNTASTAELFSWLSGTATVKVKTEQHTVGESPMALGRTYSTGDGRQALFSENDIRKIPFGRILLVWQRFDPILAYTFGIDRHPEFEHGHMPQVNAYTKIPLSNVEARAYFQAIEEQRIMDYEAWVRAGGNPWQEYTEPKPKYDGPARCTPLPEIIPYPELEKMSLEFAKQAADTNIPASAFESRSILTQLKEDPEKVMYRVVSDYTVTTFKPEETQAAIPVGASEPSENPQIPSTEKSTKEPEAVQESHREGDTEDDADEAVDKNTEEHSDCREQEPLPAVAPETPANPTATTASPELRETAEIPIGIGRPTGAGAEIKSRRQKTRQQAKGSSLLMGDADIIK